VGGLLHRKKTCPERNTQVKCRVMTYGISILVAVVIAIPAVLTRHQATASLLDASEQAVRQIPTNVEAIQMLDRDRALATDRSAFPAVLERLVAPIVSVTDRVVTGQCKGGETGYWVIAQGDNGILLFLVSTPDTSVVSDKNFICWLNPKGRIMAWGRESSL
jgi:hypothetical protein